MKNADLVQAPAHGVALATGHAQDHGFCPERLHALMAVFERDIARARLPGAVLLLARAGKVLLHRALGQQDPGVPERPMTVDALFRIYSMTKPLVSVAVLQLMERGQLLLGEPVARYLPEFAQAQVHAELDGHALLQPARQSVTVHDLLRHTAGLTYEFLGNDPIQRQYAQARLGTRERSNRELVRTLAGLPLAFEPGSLWEYSRATDVLGALVEVVSGQTLGTYLREHVFGPLAMADTGFFVPADQQHRLAEPFARDPDGAAQMRLIDVRTPAALESGGGGLVSSSTDYARFLQCLLQGGTLDGARLLSPATVRYMTSDHLGTIPVRTVGRSGELLPPGHGFGLGVAVRTHEGVAPVPGSLGMYFWGGIAGTSFLVDPRQDFFALMMVQAPNQREHYRPLFRNLIYAAMLD